MKNFIKEWIDTVRYPIPQIKDSRENWYRFAYNACYDRVKAAFEKNLKKCFLIRHRDNLCILLKRLAKGNWPKLSQKFVNEHEDVIFKVKSYVTAKVEVRARFTYKKPMYLIDKNNQMIGLVVDNDTIITGFLPYSVDYKLALQLHHERLLPQVSQASKIASHYKDINVLLTNINHFGLDFGFWVNNSYVVCRYGLSGRIPAVNNDDSAYLLFLM